MKRWKTIEMDQSSSLPALDKLSSSTSKLSQNSSEHHIHKNIANIFLMSYCITYFTYKSRWIYTHNHFMLSMIAYHQNFGLSNHNSRTVENGLLSEKGCE